MSVRNVLLQRRSKILSSEEGKEGDGGGGGGGGVEAK